MRTEIVSIALVLVACNPPVIPHATIPDSGPVDAYRGDTGTITVVDSGPMDTGVPSTDANVDAPRIDVGMRDAGPLPAVHLDGVFTEPIWTADPMNAERTNSVAPIAPYAGDTLTALWYARDADYLYLGFEGAFDGGDAVVFYVDTIAGSGISLMGTGLFDSTNTVNGVLSQNINSTALFQPEFGWGTSVMPITERGYDTSIGWRALSQTSLFTALRTDNASMCSATACELWVRLIALGVAPGGPVNFAVRVGRPGASGGFSVNQLFPSGDTGDQITATVSVHAS